MLFLQREACLVSEHLLFDLGLQAPRVDIILELYIVLEHLRHACLITAHSVKQVMLLLFQFALYELLVQLYQAPLFVV